MTKLRSFRRKSRKPRKSRKVRSIKRSVRVKSRSKKRSDETGKCLKWIKIPIEEMDDYEVGVKKCKVCRHNKLPYLFHDIHGDFTCYKCGEDVSVRYLCLSCKKK